MGNQGCCSACEGESITVAPHEGSPVDARALSLPTSSVAKHRAPSGIVGPRSAEADNPFASPGEKRSDRHDADGTGILGGFIGTCRVSSDSEKSRLRDQLKAFLVDATDSIPVNFVDVASGQTKLGSYTLDPDLATLTFGFDGRNVLVPVHTIVDVFRPEDCLAWEQAGHPWPVTRLRRLVIITILDPRGDSMYGWLEADEARRDRCIVSLSILSSPPVPGESTGASFFDRDGVGAGAVPAPRASLLAEGHTVAQLSSGVRAGSVANDNPVAKGKAPRPSGPPASPHVNTAEELRWLTKQFARDAAAGVEGVHMVDVFTGCKTQCHYRLNPALGQLIFATGPPPPAPLEDVSDFLSSEDSSCGQLRSASTAASTPAVSSGQEAKCGGGSVSGKVCDTDAAATWTATGDGEPLDTVPMGPQEIDTASATFEPAAGAGAGSAGSAGAAGTAEAAAAAAANDDADQCPPGTCTAEAVKPAANPQAEGGAVGEESCPEASASKGPLFNSARAVSERTDQIAQPPTSHHDEAGKCASTGFDDCQRSACVNTEPLLRLDLAGVEEIWRPEHRSGFAAVHSWFALMSRDERERLVCVDYTARGNAETFCIMERDRVARERFVVCAKVLRLSVSANREQ